MLGCLPCLPFSSRCRTRRAGHPPDARATSTSYCDDQAAAAPRLTHIQVLVVDLRHWFSSDRGPFKMYLVEPAQMRIESLPWEAMAFADLFGVTKVTVTYGRAVGTNDLFCDSHALSIICHLIGGRGLQGSGSQHTFHRTREARVMSPYRCTGS